MSQLLQVSRSWFNMKATIAIAMLCVGVLLPGTHAHGWIEKPGNRQQQCNSLTNDDGVFYLRGAGAPL